MTTTVESISRRRLLQSLVALCASLAAPAHANADSPCTNLLSGLDLDGLRALGGEYLNAHPQDEAVQEIRTSLQTSTDFLSDLARRMRADYEGGRLVHLSGWFLSETEGRLCAALASCL